MSVADPTLASLSFDVGGTLVNGPALVLLGAIVGLVAGMFGAGGGFLLTPLLGIVFGVPMPLAVGSGLCQMVGASTVAYLRHREAKQGEPRFALLMLPGSLLGVGLGARWVELAREAGDVVIFGRVMPFVDALVFALYVVFLSGTAFLLWMQGSGGMHGGGDVESTAYVRRGVFARLPIPPLVDLPRVPLSRVSATLIAYLGLGLGISSGVLGIGGGVILIPTLVYGFGFPFRQAVGTGISITLIVSIVGTIAHAALHNVDLVLAVVLLVGSSVTAQLGALLTTRVPTGLLRRSFAAVVAATACLIVADFVNL